ncbi:IclR family transcriptional regulator [Streptomyces massasporeus]|uniref:IclR family transcriptional regulator n=1 Tax=Streptomyces massasporeus TaxID=67324 RepID=UPI0036E998D3
MPDAPHGTVVVDRVDCDHVVRTFHATGDISPLHATATGHSVPAHLSGAGLDAVIARGLRSYSASTPVDAARLRSELARVRAGGYAVNRNQYRPGVCAIAAPVLDADGTPLAAVAVSMPDSRHYESRLPEWAAWSPTRRPRSPSAGRGSSSAAPGRGSGAAPAHVRGRPRRPRSH